MISIIAFKSTYLSKCAPNLRLEKIKRPFQSTFFALIAFSNAFKVPNGGFRHQLFFREVLQKLSKLFLKAFLATSNEASMVMYLVCC